MKKLTPAMLRKALRKFRALTKDAKGYLKDKERLGYLLREVMTRAKGRGGKLWEDIEVLVRLLKAWKSGAYKGVASQSLAAMIAAILYLITPLDFIPDFVPIVGYVDDAAVIAWLFESLADEIKKFRTWEKEL